MNFLRYNSKILFAGILLVPNAISAAGMITAKDARALYDAAKSKVDAGNLEVDWREVRLDAAIAGVNGNFDWRAANAQGIAAFNEGDFSKALDKGEEIVSHNIANGDGHFLSMVALKHLNRQAEADHEKVIVDKIVQSIVGSEDGKTAATAWFTVNTSEEYFILRLMGLQPKQQSLVQQDHHSFDKMTAVGDDNKEVVLWFNTDTDMEIMDQALKR